MSWAKLDDRFFDHPKVCAVSAEAKLLHLSGIVWCAGNLTDGQVSAHALPLVAAKAHPRFVAKAPRLVRELVAAGLWISTVDGWEIHDYLEYNPARRSVEHDREKARARMAAVRANGTRT